MLVYNTRLFKTKSKKKEKMKTRIQTLKFIEILIYISTFSIILYDLVLPKNISNTIYNFGIEKVALIVFGTLLSVYFFVAKDEKEYLKTKFSKKHLSSFVIVLILCLILYFMSNNMVKTALDNIK
jgi:undecaprenyl pyrophosphate phosphatase UppP